MTIGSPPAPLADVDSANLALVTDKEVCKDLNKKLKDRYKDSAHSNKIFDWYYYQVDDRFIVIVQVKSSDTADLTVISASTNVHVFDDQFNELGSYMR